MKRKTLTKEERLAHNSKVMEGLMKLGKQQIDKIKELKSNNK